MRSIFRIAFRSVILQKKRSLVIGFAVMLSALLLLTSDSIMNGVEQQVLKGYLNLQAGHVAVVWKDMKEVNNMETGRFLQLLKSFRPEDDRANKKAIDRLQAFLAQRADQVGAFYPTVRRFVQFEVGEKTGQIMVYGLTEPGKQFLADSRTILLDTGEWQLDQRRTVVISREMADDNDLKIGDTIALEATPLNGTRRSVDFVVKGIYANGAGYDNMYGFVSQQDAAELLGYGSGYFDAARIYLKDESTAEAFAKELDEFLTAESPVLRAESYEQASAFYMTTPKNIKFFFNVFEVFLLCIIAIGLRSTIGINLFQRMREFGTIRALGFSKVQNYMLIMLELWVLSMISLLVALGIAGAFTAYFGRKGVYVGPGPVSYALGGESFYPQMKVLDIVLVLVIIMAFCIISTLGPGLRMVHQRITDMLLNRQRKISLTGLLLKNAFSTRR
ncbi:MAG TPA: FtsX-like permease family protein [Symbiobacteriaceae bacterium]|jgi:ABC-type lipoprotein release transport system permease subunit